jgi:tape measure domain-containing protein
MAADLGSAYFTLVPSMAGFSSAVQKQLGAGGGIGTSAGRTVGSQFTGGFASVVGGGAIAGVFGGVAAAATNAIGNAVGSAFKAAGDAVIGFNSQLQNSTIGFESVLGSSKKATAFVGDLQKFAAKTPFDFQSLVQYAQTLTGFGVSAKRVIPTLTALGDAVANSGGSTAQLNGAVLAYSQLAAKQKVDLGNILQLQNAGIPALKYLAAAYHTNVGAIQDQISAGKILSADALPKLNAAIENGAKGAPKLGGAMDKLSTTFTGVVSNLQDNATQVLAKAFKPLFDAATVGLGQVATALGSPAFKNFAATFAAGLQGAISNIGAFFATAGPGFAGLAAQIGPLIPVITAFATNLGTQFAGIAAKVTPILTQIGAQLPQIFATVFPVVQAAITAIVGAIGTLLPPILQLAQVAFPLIAQAATAILPIIVNIFNSVVAAVAPLIQLLSVILPPVFQALLAIIVPIFQTIGTIITSVMQVVQGIITTVLGVITGNWSQAWNGILMILSGVWNLIVGIVSAPIRLIVSLISSALANISGTWSGVWNGIVSFFSGVWKNILSTISQGINRAVAFVTSLKDHIMGAVMGAGQWLLNAGKAIIQGFINGITGMIGAVRNAVGNVMSVVQSFFPHSPAKQGPFSGAGWRQVGKSGEALATQFTSGFNGGVKDFASTVGSIVPDTLTSSVAGTIKNASHTGAGQPIYTDHGVLFGMIQHGADGVARLRLAQQASEEERTTRLGWQPAVLGA